MIQVNLSELKQTVLQILSEIREKKKTAGNSPLANTYINAYWSLAERLLLWIVNSEKEGEINMSKLVLEFKKETVDLEELLSHRREGAIEPIILEQAKNLPRGQAAIVESGTMSWGHFASRVYTMIAKEALKETYEGEWGPIKQKDKFALAHYTKEQAAGRRKRRKKVAA